MPSKKLFAGTLICAAFLSGCYADASAPEAGLSVGGPKFDRPERDTPVPASASPDPASATRPESNEEVTDLSLG